MGSITTFLITERPKVPRDHDADIIKARQRSHFSPQPPSHVGRLSLDETPTATLHPYPGKNVSALKGLRLSSSKHRRQGKVG